MRLRRLAFTPEFLVGLTKGTYKIVADATPPGAHIHGMMQDPTTNTIVIHIEHPDFDEVKEGCNIPEMHAPSIERLA